MTCPGKQLTDAGFRGSLAWLHDQEAHAGHPYWPGTALSGVTLDPGVDLGQVKADFVVDLYDAILTDAELDAVLACVRTRPRGEEAERYLEDHPELSSLRITREQASVVLTRSTPPYWRTISRRFPGLLSAPAIVQEVMLSLAYNRGGRNRHLEVCRGPIEARDWRALGRVIGRMQRGAANGVRNRRLAESRRLLEAFPMT